MNLAVLLLRVRDANSLSTNTIKKKTPQKCRLIIILNLLDMNDPSHEHLRTHRHRHSSVLTVMHTHQPSKVTNTHTHRSNPQPWSKHKHTHTQTHTHTHTHTPTHQSDEHAHAQVKSCCRCARPLGCKSIIKHPHVPPAPILVSPQCACRGIA